MKSKKSWLAGYAVLAAGHLYLGYLRKAPLSGVVFLLLYSMILREHRWARIALYIWGVVTMLMSLAALKAVYLTPRGRMPLYGLLACTALAMVLTCFYGRQFKH